jgi:hypothetical protein
MKSTAFPVRPSIAALAFVLTSACGPESEDVSSHVMLDFEVTLGAGAAGGRTTIDVLRQSELGDEAILIERDGYRLSVIPSWENPAPIRAAPALPRGSERLQLEFRVYDPGSVMPSLTMTTWRAEGSESRFSMGGGTPREVVVRFKRG